MRYTLVFYLSFAFAAVALGQNSQPSSSQPQARPPSQAPPPASDAGVASEWDARKLIDALSAQAQHLKPLIDQVQPADWVSKGASETYVAQWNSTQAQLKYLISSSEAFSRQPERLALGLDTYFRMQAVDSVLGSLAEGVGKYQNAALAYIMQSVIAENSANRGRLQQYLRDLATQKEQEFQVADREAQRCRGALLGQPAPKTKKVSQP
ncbi:MAG: hypothetical protein ACLPWF_14030 [Bryobacteraceae bacterium]